MKLKTLLYCVTAAIVVTAPFSSLFSNTIVHKQIDATSSFWLSSSPPELNKAVSSIEKLSDVRPLLEKVARQGKIKIEIEHMPTETFEAFWDGNRRVITINSPDKRTPGSVICSILFELHNASTDQVLSTLVSKASSGIISKDEYVESVERMEHSNAVNTCALLDKGIQQGIFPVEASWYVYPNFDDHYKVQQLAGHSEWLANSYNVLNPNGSKMQFSGTIAELNNLTSHDKEDMLKYIAIKTQLESNDPYIVAGGKRMLEAEYSKLDGCYKGTSKEDCSRNSRKIQLLYITLQGNPQLRDKPLFEHTAFSEFSKHNDKEKATFSERSI